MIKLLSAAVLIVLAAFAIAPNLRAPDSETHASAGSNPAESAADISTNGDELTLQRDANGHFTAAATVNGAQFPMIVDSGANIVVLRREDALAAGISTFPGEFTRTAQTAGGAVGMKSVVLDRIMIGGIEHRNIPAAVVDADLPVSLLGQSFLSRLDEVRISGEAMHLR